MYSRKYSLKTRYNFNKVNQQGETFHTKHLIIKYLKVDPKVFEDEEADKMFGIITSNRFSKKAVVQNRARRIIAEAIRLRLDAFLPNWYYVFIPKKTMLSEGKVSTHVKEISSEIDTFLSEMAVA